MLLYERTQTLPRVRLAFVCLDSQDRWGGQWVVKTKFAPLSLKKCSTVTTVRYGDRVLSQREYRNHVSNWLWVLIP